jgi:hypothetical protein
VSSLQEAGCGRGIEVGPQGHNHHITVKGSGVGFNLAPFRVDGANLCLHEPNARLHHITVVMRHGSARCPTEHHVEL